MLDTSLLIFAIVSYLLTTALITREIRTHRENREASADGPNHRLALILPVLAAVAHLFYAFKIGQANGAINVSLSSMTGIISAILVLIYLLAGTAMPIKRLGIIVFPLTALSLLFSSFWASEANYLNTNNGAFIAHLIVSILAYSLLAIASIQALLYLYQERLLKNRSAPTVLAILPPLQTMERLLFRLVGCGFAFLTLTLISGALFSQQIFGQPFEFNHHSVLALSGWVVFTILLFKRIINGLRGWLAAVWTICGFLLIQLGYFGTKIVSESLNIQ